MNGTLTTSSVWLADALWWFWLRSSSGGSLLQQTGKQSDPAGADRLSSLPSERSGRLQWWLILNLQGSRIHGTFDSIVPVAHLCPATIHPSPGSLPPMRLRRSMVTRAFLDRRREQSNGRPIDTAGLTCQQHRRFSSGRRMEQQRAKRRPEERPRGEGWQEEEPPE